MSNILHNATVDTLLERRSIRKFKPKPLSDNIVETLETVAQHAASSQFLNDWRVYVEWQLSLHSGTE